MQRYVPVPIPQEAPEWFKTWARDHTNNLQRAAREGNDFAALRYLSKAPDRPIDGALYAADGTNWNPGSGKGMYRYDATSSAYTFLG